MTILSVEREDNDLVLCVRTDNGEELEVHGSSHDDDPEGLVVDMLATLFGVPNDAYEHRPACTLVCSETTFTGHGAGGGLIGVATATVDAFDQFVACHEKYQGKAL